ncbi:SusC/RagA family TonB-linked outer membrane protein [Filimonas effusa]|nr:SusC/RagA family TonB-linked outer membrane protein [Filimonas effusa]
MRISVILLFVLAQQVSAKTFSQTVTLTAKRVPLTQVFSTIKQQTGYSFFWDQQLLDKAPLINISVKDASIETALDNCLKGLNLSYEIKGNIVLIKQRVAAVTKETVAALAAPPQAERHKIGGVVTDETGKPLAGAIILLEPFSWKTATNNKGEYSFSDVPNGRYRLEITYVGYSARSRTLIVEGDVLNTNVQMVPEVAEQEEVVLSTGYQKLKKNTVTGSFSVISSKEIKETPSPNIMERLEGKVPGVRFDVRNNTIQVRGVSVFGGRLANPVAPLIVIDGFPYIDQQLTNISATDLTTGANSGSVNPLDVIPPSYSGNSILSSFNPDDIESITFLKDAAAAAIWGASAANGVIVIETKRGRKNTPMTVSLNATYSTSKPASVSSINAMNSAQYIDLEQELFDKGFYPDPYTSYRYPNNTEAIDWMVRAKRGMVTAAQRDSALNALSMLNNAGQMEQYLLQKVKSQQYSLNVSGGSDNMTYNISGGYMRNNPVFKSNHAENYFINSSVNNDFLNKRLSLATIVNYTYSKSNMNVAALQGLGTGTFGLAPYQMLADANGNPIRRAILFKENIADSLERLGHMSWRYNPIDELNYNNTVLEKSAIRVNVNLTGRITNWLSAQVSGQLQRNTERQDNIQDLNSYATRELVNIGSVYSAGRITNNFPKGGVYKMANQDGEDYSLRGQLNGQKSWNEGKHQLTALAGAEIRQTKGLAYKQARYGYDPTLNSSVAVNPTTPYATMYGYTTTIGYMDGNVYKTRVRYLSYYSNASYTYLGKYSISGSARFDDYTMVGVRRDKRAVPLWSAGFRWDVARENFMSGVKWINSLGFRGSWGTGGNISKSALAYPVVTIGSDSYTQRPFATINGFANPTLTWSTTRTVNAGIDAAMFNNRLSLQFDIYEKRSTNIIASFPYNPTYGFSTIEYNTGTMSNHGLEGVISGDAVKTKNFKWTPSFNISYNTNKVTDNRYPITETTSAIGRSLTSGYALDALWVFRWAGLDPTNGQGRIYDSKGAIINSWGFPSLYAKDQVYAGRLTPPVFGAISNDFVYKNWKLSTRIVYNVGHKFLKTDLTSAQYPSSTQMSGKLSSSRVLVNRWRKPGDEAFTNVPGISTSNPNTNSVFFYGNSDIAVRDASHARFQQLTLAYQFPNEMLRKTGFFKSAAAAITASNLGIIWRKNKDGIDPDYIVTETYNNLPPVVNYSLNLQLTF